MVKCYTDGSLVTQGTVKAGGWAYKIIINKNKFYVEHGKQIGINSTIMEIEAIKQLLIKLNNIKSNLTDTKIIIYSDCLSVISAINSMKNQEIIKKNKKIEMYGEIINLIKLIGFKIKFKWVKSHENDINNNCVDLLARKNARILAKELLLKRDKSKQEDAKMEKVKFISNNKDLLRKVISLDKAREAKCQQTGTKTLENDYRNYYLEQKEKQTKNTQNLIEMLDFIQEALENDYELYLENKEESHSITDFLEVMSIVDLDDATNITWSKQMQEFTFGLKTEYNSKYKLGVL